jgi:hypothetical protein
LGLLVESLSDGAPPSPVAVPVTPTADEAPLNVATEIELPTAGLSNLTVTVVVTADVE